MKAYKDLLQTILYKGTYKPAARENMPGTTSLFGYQFRHDLQSGFPLLTTKKMFWKGVVIELLWFLRGDTNIKYLVDNSVNIWNEDAYNYYCKSHIGGNNAGDGNDILKFVSPDDNTRHVFSDGHYTMLSFDEFIDKIKNTPEERLPKFRNYTLGDCGYQYGKVWRSWEKYQKGSGPHELLYAQADSIDQISNVIKSLKANPMGRRHIVTAWDPAHDNDLALTWCHAIFQFNCRPMDDVARAYWAKNNNKLSQHELMFDTGSLSEQLDKANIPKYYLDCQLYQRSADVFLGVPFNIASYALLIHIIAKMCNMVPGDFIHTFGDVHIYDNHREAVREQLSREPMNLPKIELANNVNWTGTIDDMIESVLIDDFSLVGYQSHPAIKAELSTGMKK